MTHPQDDDGWNLMMEVAARLDEEARQQQAEQSSCSAFVVSETAEPQCPLDNETRFGAMRRYRLSQAWKQRLQSHRSCMSTSTPIVCTTRAFYFEDDERNNTE